MAFQQPVPLRRLEIEPLGRHRLVGHAPGHAPLALRLEAGIVVVVDQLVAGLEGFGDLVVGRDHSLRAVVEQRLQVLVEQRQPVLHADMALAFRDRLVEPVVAGVAEQLAVAAAESCDAVLGQQHLAHRQQHDFLARAGRALAHRIERADLLQHVAEQVDAQRLCGARREEIYQTAADGELARLHHGLGAAIAVLRQERRQPGGIDRLAFLQDDRGLGVKAARRNLL